ncbi:peptidase c65 otubain protein [Rhizoctonia solani AG-3 Rhs1AP]|uniref:ubiquitinyl hydrolase 1 n=1 Tax=Rhizoctonia solani AG-3 Rhs1AP TaxID=1086054 RepID=X8JNW0_9AGAM|nr:peptidase c65 otubain protein [Rhizoctonia solani AG-3 Rhs1AP]
MSSPDSGSGWSIISFHEQEKEIVIQTQAALLEQSSAANLTRRRLGTSSAHVHMENPLPPPPPLIINPPLASPGPVAIPKSQRGPKRNGTKEFPSAGPSDERHEHRDQPPKGSSFVRKVRSSLLGGKNPFSLQNKAAEREKQDAIVIPPPLSPEPDAVIVGRPGSESNGTTPEPPVAPKSSRGPRPPVTTYSTRLYSNQTAQPVQPSRSRRGSHSSATHSQHSASEPAKTDRPPSRNKSRGSKEIQIVVLSGKKTEAPPPEREPVLGALQSHRVVSGKTTYASPTPAPTHPTIRPLPQPPTIAPTVTLVPQPQPGAAPSSAPRPNPAPTPVVATSVPQPTRPSPESLHPGAHYSDKQHYQPAYQVAPNPSASNPPASNLPPSNPPVVRYKTSSDRTSYTTTATTATTPSLSSSVTHASQPTSDAPPQGMERTPWASAPATRPAMTSHTRAVTLDHSTAAEAWTQSLQHISLRNGQQTGYHMDMSSKYESPPRKLPSSPQQHAPPISKPNKLQRHATTGGSAPSTSVTHYYYDPSPPLVTRVTRLSELKEDYRNPGSERSAVIRRKINFLRFELGYTGLRRARGDGNCFYRSFAFCYLEQILFAEDRAMAVVSALEHLEIAQNLLEAAIPNNKFSKQMHLFLRDLIRNIELGKTDQKRLLRTFQDPRDSDDLVAYVRLLASAYIRLTPEMHASVFHPDDPAVVISPVDFCRYFVEEMNQDADHLQISALSRTLNVAVYIYRLDEKVDGVAPNDQDIPAHCTRFTPIDAPTVTEPVALLFRPGHYDILERHPENL